MKTLGPTGSDPLAFERLLAELSATFVDAGIEEVDELVHGALAAVVETLGLDRASLSQFSPDGEDLVLTHSWAVDAVEPAPRAIVGEEAPWVVRRIASGERIHFADPSELPEEAGAAIEYARRLHIRAHATLPLTVGSEVVGGLHVASIHRRIDWAPVLPRLEVLARIFASALARKQADLRLREALREVEALKARLEEENLALREQLQGDESITRLVGESALFRRVLERATQVADTGSAVLLLGETGTGKDLLAHAIHRLCPRRDHSIVEVDCTLLPASLIESELFGHEKGAFSGADRTKPGHLELAEGGTLFLDEIGELPIELQGKFLRFLESGRVSRLGSNATRRLDVRVIAATNRDLEAEAHAGRFRQDLYYRLSVFPIELPPLRERRDDIPLLVWHFTELLQGKIGRHITTIAPGTMRRLRNYDWPGNVRELKNVVERSLILSHGAELEVDSSSLAGGEDAAAASGSDELASVERRHILGVLEACDGRIKGPEGAAERLGLKPSTLYYRLKKLGIERS